MVTIAAVGGPVASVFAVVPAHLHGVASAGSLQGLTQTITNTPVASLSGLHNRDTVGNDALASGSLLGPSGRISLSTHACSGGGVGFGGSAHGAANSDIYAEYTIISPTLPVGTPVPVRVNWAINARVTAVGQDLSNVNDSAGSIANAQIAIDVNGNTRVYVVSGSVTRGHSAFGGFTVNRSGNVNPEGDSYETTLTLLVGQRVAVSLNAELSNGSTAFPGATADGDAQLALVWGVTSLDPAASAFLTDNLAEPAPPASSATPADAVAARPARPTGPGMLPCFRIPTQPAGAAVCAGASPNLTVGVLGTGPFSYRWSKDGVPVDSDLNPSATTATLALPNTVPGDAGSYTCVITNPCGDITTNPAVVSVASPLTIVQHPAGAVTCSQTVAAFGVVVSPSAGSSFQWQWQPVSGGPWTDIVDGPNSDPQGGPNHFTAQGSQASTLSVAQVGGSGVAQSHWEQRCVVTNACGSVTSNSAMLTGLLTCCPADLDDGSGDGIMDGGVDINDLLYFLSRFEAGSVHADLDDGTGTGTPDGGVDVNDLLFFLVHFESGC